MRKTARVLLGLGLLLAAGCRSVPAGQTRAASPQNVRVTIETRDAAPVTGALELASITVKTASAGKIVAPVSALSAIEYGGNPRYWKIVFRNGDVFHGALGLSAFELTAPSGKVSIPLQRITRVDISHPVLTAFPITFTQPGDALDWIGLHNVTPPAVAGGALVFEVTGQQPYLHRQDMQIPASTCPVLVIRMKKEAGSAGHVYWMTDTQGGFVDPAYLRFKTIPDGRFHDVFVPVVTNPLWRGTITALRIDPDVAGEKGRVAIESISAAQLPAVPAGQLSSTDPGLSVFDGKPFRAMPDWIKNEPVSNDWQHTTEPGFGYFFVRDPNRSMKWAKQFPEPVDPNQWPYLEMEYHTAGIVGDADGYILWLFDGRPGNYAGFAAIVLREIVSDGETHSLVVPLARFNPAGPITGCAVSVTSGSDGWGSLLVHRLRFLRSRPQPSPAVAAAAVRPPEITRCRGAFEMNKDIWISLSSPVVGAYVPAKVRTVSFFEKRNRFFCRVKLEGETSTDGLFAVRVKLLNASDAGAPLAVSRHKYRVAAASSPMPSPLSAEKDFDLGPSKDLKSVAAFEVEIENLTTPAASAAKGRSAKSGWAD